DQSKHICDRTARSGYCQREPVLDREDQHRPAGHKTREGEFGASGKDDPASETAAATSQPDTGEGTEAKPAVGQGAEQIRDQQGGAGETLGSNDRRAAEEPG